MRVLGMISGTSHDGIDVAVVDFDASGRSALSARIEHTASIPYDPALRRRLVAALPPSPVGFDEACALDTLLGQAFAGAAVQALADHAGAGGGAVDAICSHGQTVFHWVDGAHALGTLQLGQPAWIAEATGLTVVSDVRAADIAAGGHGAPLVPILDTQLLAPRVARGERAAALNLGGISNMTVCDPDRDPVAWDIGPANALIDAAVVDATAGEASYDRDGALAAAGSVVAPLLEHLLAEPYYALTPPKSSGKELFHGGYVAEALKRTGLEPSLEDLVATLTELTAVTVADAVRAAEVTTLVASGGGVRNPVLMVRLADLLPGVEVTTTDAFGVPSDEKEAVAFAMIGWATLHGLPSNVPSCTGASGPRVLGRVTPGRDGLTAGASLAAWPEALAFEGRP
ncbi:anhydro-N-acetylmuramic acid kinase [Mumia sp. DW29H23]|uniref:anhydro-N-acetylmuramic acid kinase n=1 Tax=Mumia sp. DW29H23 TaxID=3421241 RepID=UPI003D690B6D